MNEQQRADFLARAVDDLISGIEPLTVPAALDARDVDAIVQIAKNRLEIGRSSANDGLQYEGPVWQRVLERLDSAGKVMSQGLEAGQSTTYDLSDELELREMAVLRRQMSAQLHAFAETHREDIWRRVRERALVPVPKQRHFFFFSRGGQAYADLVAPALDSVAQGRPAEVGDTQLDEIVRVAWNRKAASQSAAALAEARRERVWSKVLANVTRTPAPQQSGGRSLWPRAVAVGAMAVVVIAAIGPLPATGFADHPAAQAVRFLGGHVGVTETTTPPEPGDGRVVDGHGSSPEQASAELGFEVLTPSAPSGFELTATEVFPIGITSESGMFVTNFAGVGDRTITVYQERATRTALAAATGSATDMTLADGTPATYFSGQWSAADGTFTWVLAGTQTLVFNRDGVRTIIVQSGWADAAFLVELASSLSGPP